MTSGLDRINAMFSNARERNRGLLMPFLVGGHPQPGGTGELIKAVENAGADGVEIGFPFSDPIADGPVVAAAMHDALTAGASPRGVMSEIAAIRSSTGLALIAMVSVSIAERLGGPHAFVADAVAAGFDGFIFPDIAVEEAGPYSKACDEHNAGCTLLIAPTTPIERCRAIADASSGFVYMLARAGVTGERTEAPAIGPRVRELRSVTSLPIAVGFGISTPEHVRAVVAEADAAIVGSALVRRISSSASPTTDATSFIADLASGCSRA